MKSKQSRSAKATKSGQSHSTGAKPAAQAKKPEGNPATAESKSASESRSGASADRGPAVPLALSELYPQVPAILLEGDGPETEPAPAPLEKASPATANPPKTGELPEAYGTGRLFLTPRDPHSLCAQWDFTTEQLRYYNSLSVDRHLIIRMHYERQGGELAEEVHVRSEARHWFISVAKSGVTYVAELGCYVGRGQWRSVAVSESATTPAEAPREQEMPLRFAEFQIRAEPPQAGPAPEQLPPPDWLELGEMPAAALALPLMEAEAMPAFFKAFDRAISHQKQTGASAGQRPFPPTSGGKKPAWTSAQKQALAELMGLRRTKRSAGGSLEITELMAGAPEGAISSAAAQAPVRSEEQPGISSPTGPQRFEQKGGFWLNVNAELVIYGATEPDAGVTIGGRQIRLRADGTFSYRFSLPDGTYALPICAEGGQGDTRAVELRFYRDTLYEGEVGAHPQDSGLKPPNAENVQAVRPQGSARVRAHG